MDQQIQEQQLSQSISELEQKIEKLQRSIDRMNKIFLWTLIITVGLMVVPLIGILFTLPGLISGLSNVTNLNLPK